MLLLACLPVYGIVHLLTRDLLMQRELSHQHEPRERPMTRYREGMAGPRLWFCTET